MYGHLMDFKEFTETEIYKTLPQEIGFDVDLKKGELSLNFYGKQSGQRKVLISDDTYFEWLHCLMFNYFGNY
tara:strand:- start:336 stop:551 length:216 start_codon:yes stop_codon:yes gene_type:complete